MINDTDIDPALLPGIAASPGPIIRLWEHAGLLCLTRPGFHGCNGYVQLPPPFPGRKLLYQDLQDAIDVHGGLTYGMDDGGWIGFDTAHAWDHWLDPDAPETKMDRISRQHGLSPPTLADIEHGVIWTLERLYAETERLAEQAAAWAADHDDYQSALSPAEHLARTRARLRETMRLVHEEGLSFADACARVWADTR